METTRRITSILIFAVAFCFAPVSLAQTEEKATSLNWIEYKPNPRFAIHDPGTPTEQADDLVLDRKTGLIWARNAHLAGKTLTWEDAINYCQDLALGNLEGWRLPTKEELSSMVDPSKGVPALPSGHPFINVKFTYWSSTEFETDWAWNVHVFTGHGCHWEPKLVGFDVWPVLGR
jgi:hypothetical protein